MRASGGAGSTVGEPPRGSRASTGAAVSGSSTANVEPTPTWLVTSSVPPITSTRCLDSARVERDPVLGREGADDVESAAQGLAHRDRLQRELQAPGLDPADVEHLVDQSQEMPARLEDLRDAFLLIHRERLHLQELREA